MSNHKPQPYTFVKYQSIYDNDLIFYALEKDAMKKIIDGFEFIEVTPDFARAQFVRTDSLKAVGSTVRMY